MKRQTDLSDTGRDGQTALLPGLMTAKPHAGRHPMTGLMGALRLICCLTFTALAEAGIHVPAIASLGADADTEAVVAGPVEPSSRLMIDMTVTNPTSGNAVLLAFGRDLDADGELSAEETMYRAGWDAGAWVEYPSDAVDAVPLQGGVSGDRLSMQLIAGDWDLVSLVVRGDAAGKVFAGKPPTIILLR